METRLKRRYKVTLKLICRIEETNHQHVRLACGDQFEGIAYDISEGGVGFFIKYYLPKGLIIKMEIGGKPFGLEKDMKTECEVCYCISLYKDITASMRYKCGVKFINISEADRKRIARFISTHENRKTPRFRFFG